MSQISLSLFKQHVRADEFEEDDELLQHYLDTAEAYVVKYTHRTLDELKEMGGGALPLQIQQAILKLAGDWYDVREDSSQNGDRPVSNGFRTLAMQFRKLSNTIEENP